MLYILSDDTVVELATPSDPTQQSDSDLQGLDVVASGTDVLTDDTLYLSQIYYDKDINDVYSMLVSCRNCLILLIFVILVFGVHNIIKNAFKRHYRIEER